MASANSLASVSPSSPKIVIGSETLSHDTVADKMRQDIAFLGNRICELQRQANPNPKVLKVYQDMLDGRHAILSWLEQSQRRAASK